MRRLSGLLGFLVSVHAFQAQALARESVTVQAARVQSLLQNLQVEPGVKPELAQSLRKTIVASQKQLAREQLSVVIKPGRIPTADPTLVTVEGLRFVLPKLNGQRRCEAIQEDWRALDRVYQEVSDLALELEEVYGTPEFCAPCADTVLRTLQEATEELEGISTRLNSDGERHVLVIWEPEDFLQGKPLGWTALNWDKLVYYNIDGDSRVGDASHPLPPLPGFSIRSPLLQNGLQFQTETTAERACSPGFEIRLDGIVRATLPIREKLQTVSINLRLIAP